MNNPAKARFLRLQALYRSGDSEACAKAVHAALRATPKEPNLLHLAAQVAETQGEAARAILFYRRALEAHPNWLEATFNLATVLHKQSQTAEAIVLMTKISRTHSDFPQAYEALARFHQTLGDFPQAITHWEKALSLMPDQQDWRAQCLLLKRQLCDWGESLLAVEKLPPQAVTVLTDDPAIQQAAAVRYAQQKFGAITPFAAPMWESHPRLRVGYLSADFHAHATAYLMAELFELHDATRFDIFAYSYGVDDRSAIRARLKQHVEHFVDLNNLTAKQAAERIRDDEIDILVDLKGYTRGSRLEILAYRPARVQMHWLGYPGTLGTNFIDYFVADEVTVARPPVAASLSAQNAATQGRATVQHDHDESFFTEKVLRLPHCYQINDRQRTIGEPLSRSAYGLPDNAFVLASFNQTYKITPDMFAIWCAILKELPEAVLWLYQSNPYAPDNLRSKAQEHGIDPSRLIFALPLPLDQHLARYAHVDLALDTHPVGGHTTTSDALWAGTPVVTMIGQSFVARVAASVLTAAGLPEMVCGTAEEYKQLALALGRDKEKLANLKQHLKSQRSLFPLFDTPRFVRRWEAMLGQITPASAVC